MHIISTWTGCRQLSWWIILSTKKSTDMAKQCRKSSQRERQLKELTNQAKSKSKSKVQVVARHRQALPLWLQPSVHPSSYLKIAGNKRPSSSQVNHIYLNSEFHRTRSIGNSQALWLSETTKRWKKWVRKMMFFFSPDSDSTPPTKSWPASISPAKVDVQEAFEHRDHQRIRYLQVWTMGINE